MASTAAAAEVVSVTVEGHVAVVTLRRPDARNAINHDVATQLCAAADRIEADPDIWVAVLTGQGGVAFCAGADLKEVSSRGLAGLYTERGGFAGFVRYPREKVWIAAVEGFAVAGGCEIALACDLIVASETSSFALPEVKRGLIAAAGGLFRLPRALPRVIANELIATGDSLPAARAAELGLINRVTAPGAALAEAVDLASRIAGNAPIAVRESLKIARTSYDSDHGALFDLSNARQAVIMATEDFKEGPRAFIEKRPPRWQGR